MHRIEWRWIVFAIAGTLLPARMPAFAEEAKPKTNRQAEEEERRKAEKEAEPAAREKIVAFNKALQTAKSAADIGNAIRSLDVKHPLIVERLVQLFNSSEDETIQSAVVDAFVKLDDARCVPILNTALLVRLGKWRDNVNMITVLLKALGHFGDVRGAPAVAKALDCNDNGVATEACTVSSRIKDPLVVDELISLLRDSEQEDVAYNSSRGGRGGRANAQMLVNRRKVMREPAQKALQDITGKSFGSSHDWQSWWSANKASWRPTSDKGA
jgi:hypothetical protein